MRRLLLGGLAALAIVAGTGTPAAAHPFGPPSTAQATVRGTELTLVWHAAEDDWVALGQSLGAFDEPATDVTGEQKLRRSPAVRDYLLKATTVRQAGQACSATLAELADLIADGARFTFDCPAPVAEVELRLAALMDLNEAYRTVLVGAGEAVFTAASPAQQVHLTASSGRPAALVPLAAGTGAVLMAGLGALLALRARRRRRG